MHFPEANSALISIANLKKGLLLHTVFTAWKSVIGFSTERTTSTLRTEEM